MSASNTDYGRNLRRLVWAVLGIDVAAVGLSLWLNYRTGALFTLAPGGGDLGGSLFALAQVAMLGFGALITLRLPRHAVGWLLLAAGSFGMLELPVGSYVRYAVHARYLALPGADLIGTVDQMAWVPEIVLMAILLPLFFPTGKLLSPRWRIVVWVAVAAATATILGGAFSSQQDPTLIAAGVRLVVAPPPLRQVADLLLAAIVLLPAAVLAAVLSLAVRYRRGGTEERHQLKWLIFAVSVYGLGFAGGLPGMFLQSQLGPLENVGLVGLLLIPVAVAAAVLKYRLYDIDIIISRTLVYGALAALITAIYVGIVVGIGHLIGAGGQPNLLLSIVATAIVAVAFQPARERLQKIANRLVYGKRATPYEVLSQFSERVAETYAAEEALPRMARVLAEGTGAERARVWLRAGTLLRPAASWPERDGAAQEPVPLAGDDLPDLPGEEAVSVRQQGDLLGALSVTKRQGEALTPIERKLLDDLAHQAGLVLKNVGLTAELLARLEDLRASRQRLVAAQDEERRRLERNLHDGAQQNLVAIKVKLGLAEALSAKDPTRAKELIGQLKRDTDEALETLRDLARGIYPPLLADKGLAAALESQARKATLPVSVDADGVGRYPQETEAAVYFCVLEALQNIQKYARATRATVSVSGRDGQLTFEVGDDGIGFNPAAQRKGSGTQNMEDRLDALGGSIQVRSAVGVGTTVAGRLPLKLGEVERQPA
jgi:signal transduction histidine kinase